MEPTLIKCTHLYVKTNSRCSAGRNRTRIEPLLSGTWQSNSLRYIHSEESGPEGFPADFFWKFQLTDEVRRVKGVTGLQVCPVNETGLSRT